MSTSVEKRNRFGKRRALCLAFMAGLILFSAILCNATNSFAETLILHPSGKNATFAAVGPWTVVGAGFTYADVFDKNDSDASHIQDSALSDKLYLDLDDTTLTGFAINDVQVFAVARSTGSSTGIQVGFRAGPTDTTDRLGSSRTVRSSSYRSYSGSLYLTNPRTSAAWTWSDINSLIPMINHSTNASALRITEVFVKVNYTKAVSPSGKNGLSTGWAFTPAGSEATALDSNDGDTSYAQSTVVNEKLYMDLDDFPNATTFITGVRLKVVAKCITIPCNLQIGIRTNGTDYMTSFDQVPGSGTIYSTGATTIHGNSTNFTSQLAAGSQITALGQTRTVASVTDRNDLTVSSAFSPQLPNQRDAAVPFTFIGATASYETFSGEFYTENPATRAPWTWTDINNMMAVINHVTNSNELRITQVYLAINFIDPVALSYTPDTGYGSTKGVFPASGGASTSFTYKIVYTNLNNHAPTSIKVHIDGDGGHAMTRDVNAQDPEYYDLDYVNGEQYIYTASSLSSGQHTYYFAAADGADSALKPAAGTLAGPGVSIPAGTDTILPSGENALTSGDWGFNGADATTALDTADGNTSYADLKASAKGETLYVDLDDSGLTGSITAVQVSAVMCAPTNAATVRIGLRLNGTDYVSTAFSVAVSASCSTYTTYTPVSALYKINPDTGKVWNWDDINEMIGVVLNESTQDLRITQFKVDITHTPVILSFPDEAGYDSIDGVNPDSGKTNTTFTYKVIYSNANGAPPAAGYPKLHIDGNAAGVAMALDTAAADPTLHDGNFIDGEQYTYTYTTGFPTGTTRNYYFDASDGTASVVFPPTGNFSGPAISLPASTFILHPKDVADGTSGFSFCTSFRNSDCFDPATALDTNDGDSTYARGRRSDDYLYMSMDDARNNGQFITSVQVSAVVRSESGTASFTLGLSSSENHIEGSVLSASTSYTTLSGTVYGFNPLTGAPWTWTDIQNLVVVVHHTNNSRMRVTEVYVTVGYGPVRLQNSTEAGYINNGVNPALGKTGTPFTFKTVYYQVNNLAPAAGNPKVHIDGSAGGVAMTLDTAAAAALRDGDYTNGEQYVYTTNALAQGTHNYYFDATDTVPNSARLPAGTATYGGPDVALNGGAPNLAPSGKVSSTVVASTGWTFCNATPTCSASGTGAYADTVALDTDDADTSFARSTVNGDRLYMEFDDPASLSDALTITSIQLFAVARDVSSSTTTGFDFGLRLGDDDYLSGTTKTPPDAYGTAIAGAIYTTNPATGEQWTWNDIKGMRAVVVHQTNANEIRVTQIYMTVTYSPIQLTFSTDPRYFDDGVDPNGGVTGTPFNYRIVYTQSYGVAPAAGYPKVHIDGNATGVVMILDTQAPPKLQDGNYSNGEQYIYTTTLAPQGTPHNYYFDVSDGTNTMRTPLSGTLSGPVVSGSAPTLSFTSETGYTLQSTGTGTLSTSGTSTVTGTGTSFTTQLRVGATIVAGGGQTRTITAITNNTTLTVDTPFSPNLSGATFTYSTWSGIGTVTTSGTNTVTGSGTSFTTQLQVGSTLTAAGQTRTVTAIASDTSLTVDSPYSPNLSAASFAFLTDLPLRGVEPNTGTVNTRFTFKVVYTDADNNPPVVGYPRLLLDYNTVVYAMALDTGATDATLRDGNYTNGEQYTVTVYIDYPGTHAYSFDATDGVAAAVWPLDGDGFLAPSVTDSVSSGVIIYPASRNSQTTGFTFLGTDQDPSTALDAGYDGNGTISNAASATTVTGIGTNFSAMPVGSILTAGSPHQKQRVTAIANDTSLTTSSAFSPNLNNEPWRYDGDVSYARGTRDTHRLYMNMDDVRRSTTAITSVQFFAIVRDSGSSSLNFSVGLQIGGTDYTSTYSAPGTSTYTTYAGTLYATNPKTGTAWTWNDIANLLGVVKLTQQSCSGNNNNNIRNCQELRVTQMYVRVNYNSLPTLSYSPEGGYYGADGVDPDGWNPAHIYTYKVVYSSGSNFAPTSLKVFIDGDAGHDLIHDGLFITNDLLRNGDYTDGEQFYYSTNPNQLAVGPHTYYFLASDGGNTYRLPTSGTLPGPNVSVNEPFLQFSTDSGFGTGGVNPNNGESGSTQFTYKVVYTHPDNNRPLSVLVHIDGDTGRPMVLDNSASAALKDGNYLNGEQFTYTTNLAIGSHTYLFEATDGAKQVFLPVVPALGILSGPTVTDSIAPNAVTNLSILNSARTPTSTTLTWTAPGDAGAGAGCPCGTVTSYNIRYSTLKIIDDAATPAAGEIRFSNATAASANLTPRPAGSTETFTITGLKPNTPYYFAMTSTDAKPWTSPMSNVVNAANNPPIPATDLLSGWNMVSVPTAAVDVVTAFGSSVGVPVNVKKWVSTGTTNQTGSFILLSGSATIQPGIGYFLQTADDTRFLTASAAANTAATFSIPLMQGYNIIGNPYTKDVNLDATCVSQNGGTGTCTSAANAANFKSYANAVAAGWVGNALYQWDGISYTFKTYNDPDPTLKAKLQLWQGYWLQVTDANAANTYNLVVVKP